MVSATATPSSPTAAGDGLTSESLEEIDLSKLSQSELHALSLCSKSAIKHNNNNINNDLISPQLNPSTFNKSAGARRQTYSRPYRRCLLSPKTPNSIDVAPSPSDPTKSENKAILGHLKNLLGDQEEEFSNPEREIESNLGAIVAYVSNERKRKRSKSKMDGNGVGAEVELLNVNSNGVVVDFQELANSDDYYSEELKKRTEGLGTEEEGLEFLRGLNGEWCSRRKKRKFVDASEFGDNFPVGWKILLGLRRRDGCVSVYCRRYVSPAGEHFVSCKEASLYLRSYFKDRANQKSDQTAASVQQVGKVASETDADVNDMESDMQVDTSPILSTNDEELDLLGTGNLFEVQIRDFFDCPKCNLAFEHKSNFLRHLFEVHQNTTRRYRLGKSVGDSLIMDDEQYKWEKKKRSCEAQVKVHLKNSTKNYKELPVQITDQKSTESPSKNELPSRTSMLDALAEIAHNSMLENSKDGPIKKPRSSSSPNNLNMEISATNSDHEQSSVYHPTRPGTGMAASALAPKLKLCDGGHITADENIMRIDGISDIGNSNVVFTSTLDHPKPDKVKKYGSSELKVICGENHVNPNEILTGATMQIKENLPQTGITDSSMLSVKSLHCMPAFDPISNKKESGVLSADQLIDNVSGYEELRFAEIETLSYSFVDGQQSVSLPEVSMELHNDAGTAEVESETVVLNNGGNAGIEEVGPQIVALKNGGNVGMEDVEPDCAVKNSYVCLITSVCVWCAKKFTREAVESEDQSESVGFMCSTCKATISKHLDNGFHHF